MYYELILNEENKIALIFAQNAADILLEKATSEYQDIKESLDDQDKISLTTLKLAKQKKTVLCDLIELLYSFEESRTVIIEGPKFYDYREKYLTLDENIDKLFSLFNKKSSKNTINNNNYRVQAMTFSYEASVKELNSHQKIPPYVNSPAFLNEKINQTEIETEETESHSSRLFPLK